MPQVDKPWHPYMVLVASDNEWGARSLDSVLETSGYAVLKAETGQEALHLALTAQPHAVILDTHTPDMSGIEVCRLLTGDPRFLATTPVIMTTSDPNTRAERLEAYGAGAWEFYSRPFDGAMLLLKLQTFMRAKQTSERWREGSLVDATTGLYNMEGLRRRAREIGAHAFRFGAPVACVAFAGSVASDRPADSRDASTRVAEHVAEACRRNARSSDVVGHLDDTHCGFIAPSTDARGATLMVNRLRSLLEAESLVDDRSAAVVRIRAGFCATPNFAESTLSVEDMLLQAAERALCTRPDAGDGAVTRQLAD